nr:hypothetical protein [Tanacetum cinerariifolium]
MQRTPRPTFLQTHRTKYRKMTTTAASTVTTARTAITKTIASVTPASKQRSAMAVPMLATSASTEADLSRMATFQCVVNIGGTRSKPVNVKLSKSVATHAIDLPPTLRRSSSALSTNAT